MFVRCSGCGGLVARYQLRSYYHHGKGLESFARSIGADAADSGRATLAEFERAREESLSGFERALAQLHEEEKDV